MDEDECGRVEKTERVGGKVVSAERTHKGLQNALPSFFNLEGSIKLQLLLHYDVIDASQSVDGMPVLGVPVELVDERCGNKE